MLYFVPKLRLKQFAGIDNSDKDTKINYEILFVSNYSKIITPVLHWLGFDETDAKKKVILILAMVV